MKTKLVKWWPISRPIPKGWRIADQALSHHSAHSVLIENLSAHERDINGRLQKNWDSTQDKLLIEKHDQRK